MTNDLCTKEVLSVRRYKAGYEVRTERCVMDECPEMTLKSAYTPEGHYIGDSAFAHRLVKRHGIKPELSNPSHSVCSIGFCPWDAKWYGWSHRAIFGFGIGAVVKEGDCVASSGWTEEYLREHPEEDLSLPVGFEAKTLGDARLMAVAFADSVS